MTNQAGNKTLQKLANLQRQHKGLINLMPLQTGGILTDAAREALIEFGDGYSVCDFCEGSLCSVTNPPIRDFVQELLPQFLGCEVATITHGAREAKFMVMHSLAKPGDSILVDANRHYTTIVAAERAGLNIIEVPNSGHPEFRVDVDGYAALIKEKPPKLILLTYPDGNYGNLPDAKRLGEIAQEYNIPYIINGAYAVGRMPISMDEIGADFIIGSGHKSMASAGPAGVLGMKKKSEELLEMVGLAKRAKEQVRKYSGGMKRRLSIAMALVSDPQVLFLDEPTLGLDPQSRRGIWEHITELKGKKTIVLTTHYLEEADALADRIAIIDDGKIAALGTPQELKDSISDLQVMVVQAKDLPPDVIEGLKEIYPEVKATEDGIEIKAKELSFYEIVDYLRPRGVAIQSTSLKQPTLDDVFLHLTGKELRE